jgi:hypothetical protein
MSFRKTRILHAVALLLPVCAFSCSAKAEKSVTVRACNGHERLCDRRYDEVSYPTTHNAMSNADDGWINPNQEHGIARQLADGVRGMMLDLHYDRNEIFLCHGFCELGKKPLAEGLAEIRTFMQANPGEVISIIFETYVTPVDVKACFERVGMMGFLHVQVKGEPWPTLREMVASGRRLIVFAEKDGGAYPWYHDVWLFAWDTPYSFKGADEFTCAKNRGDFSNELFILNHFISNPLPDIASAREVNVNPVLANRANECRAESGRLPNFVAVDFYSIGDLFEVVNTMNGIDEGTN